MQKTITVDGVDAPIVLSRRKGTRNLKISLNSDGRVRLSVPYGVPDMVAARFARSKASWIAEHLTTPTLLQDGAHIGKAHILSVTNTDISRPSTKVTSTAIRVNLPLDTPPHSSAGQTTIRRACEKAILTEAKSLLPQRFEQVAKTHSVDYASLHIKKLKSRWGACDQHNNISLNSYLIQLDWSLIDYVICHELAHTYEHNHSAAFWHQVEQMLPDYKALRKILKQKPTDIYPT